MLVVPRQALYELGLHRGGRTGPHHQRYRRGKLSDEGGLEKRHTVLWECSSMFFLPDMTELYRAKDDAMI